MKVDSGCVRRYCARAVALKRERLGQAPANSDGSLSGVVAHEVTHLAGYRYFKYYMLVKYLVEVRKLSVEEVFTRSIDVRSLEREVLNSL
jgi:predicted SprT family Zn-dependent metalloprotease